MLDLSSPESSVRVGLSEKHGRIIINRADLLLVLCLRCGGAKSIVLHKLAGSSDIPPVFECGCDPVRLYPPQEETHASCT